MSAQRPLELILARNLLSSLSTPGLLVGEGGSLLFYNESAGAIIGRSFEDVTGLSADEWTREFGPLDAEGEPIAYDNITATQTLRAHMPFHGEFSIKTVAGRREIALTAIPIVAPDESTAAVVLFWPTDGEPVHAHAAHLSGHAHVHDAFGAAPSAATSAGPGSSGAGATPSRSVGVKVKVWGARGSIPAPGPDTMRYGGNTSCVELTLSDGSTLILDAGTGIRHLGMTMQDTGQPVNILLTHLHMDHIQGFMFFAPVFQPSSEIVVWGPASPEASLRDRIARYISAPLAPVEVRELPSLLTFHEADSLEWQIGPARIRAQAVNHRGPTLGYRIEDNGTVVTYIPDHEPGLGAPLASVDDEWISGFDLAKDATLLIHDCQYTDAEYENHLGWGHCPVSDALEFARRTTPEQVLLFHHDPLHSDESLDELSTEVVQRWQALGGEPGRIGLATERLEVDLTRSVDLARPRAQLVGQVAQQPTLPPHSRA